MFSTNFGEKIEIFSEFWCFHISLRSSTFLTACWLSNLCYPSLAGLYQVLIDTDRYSNIEHGVLREKLSKTI